MVITEENIKKNNGIDKLMEIRAKCYVKNPKKGELLSPTFLRYKIN